MTLRHMKIFVVVYQEMNITKAAGILHMTQPAVTRSIQELEYHYGIQLFERLNHKLYKTRLSDEFYSYALHMTDSFDLMEKRFKDQDKLGFLRVGASITLGNHLMPKALCRLKEEDSSFEIKVMVSNGESLQRALLDNKIDLAFIEGNFSSDYLCSEQFMKDRLVLIMSPGYELYQKDKIYLRDLIACPLLLREKGSAGRSFVDHIFESHDLVLNPIWESTSTEALVKAVGSGLGISLLPEQLVKDGLLSGRIVSRDVEEESFERTNYILWHKNKYLTPSINHFISICREISEEL